MKTFFTSLFLAFGISLFAQVPPPPAASVAEVQAGTIKNKYVSPYTLANGGNAGGVTTNGLYNLPFVVLHNNYTATMTNPATGFSTNYNFAGSPSHGFNDIQAIFGGDKTNSAYAGFSLSIDNGYYPITSLLVLSNTCIIDGNNAWFQYVGATNAFTLNAITNAISQAQLLNNYSPASALSLISIQADGVDDAGFEAAVYPQVTLKNLRLTVSTNMYCFGAFLSYGDHTDFENVIVGGQELFTTPPYWNAFQDPSKVLSAPKMIGFGLGDNQPKLVSCSAQSVADGIIIFGNCLCTAYNFNAVVAGYWNNNLSSAYPSNSIASLGAGIMVAPGCTAENIKFYDALTYSCFRPVVNLSYTTLNLIDWTDQDSRKVSNVSVTENGSPLVSIVNMAGLINTVTGLTNAPNGFYMDDSNPSNLTNSYASVNEIMMQNGPQDFQSQGFSVLQNGVNMFGYDYDAKDGAVDFTINPDLPVSANGAGVTNIPATSLNGSRYFAAMVKNSTENYAFPGNLVVTNYQTIAVNGFGANTVSGTLTNLFAGNFMINCGININDQTGQDVTAGIYTNGVLMGLSFEDTEDGLLGNPGNVIFPISEIVTNLPAGIRFDVRISAPSGTWNVAQVTWTITQP